MRLFITAFLSVSIVTEVSVSDPVERRYNLGFSNLEVLWCLFRWTLQNCIKSIDRVSSISSSPISTVATRSLTDIAVELDAIVFVRDVLLRWDGERGEDGRSIFISRRSGDGQFLLFLYVVRSSSLLTVCDLSLLALIL